ncbi:MAG: EamA family transporter [Betaproteobacteria bacterium]|nr:EamA family transporter [Betaproteobacteria bacterium]
MSYVYVACTILLMVYAQIVIKWQVSGAGAFPDAAADKLWFLARLLVDPWIVSALAAMLLAALAWMAAMTKLDLSHAYPFTSLAFVLVMIASAFFFHEPVTGPKIAGIALICLGIVIGSQG